MPVLPSGLKLALLNDHIVEPKENLSQTPEGHFWYGTPDLKANQPPFEHDKEYWQVFVTASIPTSAEEVKQYIRVCIGLPDGMMYWRGDTLADFPNHMTLDSDDYKAWQSWLASEPVLNFLQNTLIKCQSQARTVAHVDNKTPTQLPEQEVTSDFAELCKVAYEHLNKQVQGGIQCWIKANLRLPFLEHMSFRLGNQLFFIRLEDIDEQVHGPASINGLLTISDGCEGHACLMPMKKSLLGGWQVEHTGWGLIDARTGNTVDPFALVTDEQIEMSDWELQDFAVQVVRKDLEKQGYEIMSWQSNPQVNPSIWFIGDSKAPEWVVVSFSRKSRKPAPQPKSWESISQGCSHLSKIGHFAPVYPASTDDPFDPICGTWMPLYRGHAMVTNYKGLEAMTTL